MELPGELANQALSCVTLSLASEEDHPPAPTLGTLSMVQPLGPQKLKAPGTSASALDSKSEKKHLTDTGLPSHRPRPKFKGGWEITSLVGGFSNQSLLPIRLKSRKFPRYKKWARCWVVQNSKCPTMRKLDKKIFKVLFSGMCPFNFTSTF